MRTSLKIIGITFLISFLMSCASPVIEQKRTGFISDYNSLKQATDTRYAFNGGNLAEYSSFIIDRPEILFRLEDLGKENIFTEEEVQNLVQYYHDRLIKAISEKDGYTVTDKPAKGVARIRVGLTALDKTIGALNVTIYTKITGAGLGGAAMEGELVDSVTGEQLSAVIQWGSGSRILRAGYTKLGDAKLQINKWSKLLREGIDEAHGL
ncbi:MAG: DUF3313 domain-containing protein [Pseudomonadales bacterium]|nr:DUF3313 domain-containing protein [Pseudomonadales bacterium]